MSVVEDTRKLVQDFLAPELREIAVRLDAPEKQLNARIDNLDARTADRFIALEARTNDRFGMIGRRFDAVDNRFDAVDKRFDAVDKRFDAVERKAAERHDALMQKIDDLADLNELKVRMARLEARENIH